LPHHDKISVPNDSKGKLDWNPPGETSQPFANLPAKFALCHQEADLRQVIQLTTASPFAVQKEGKRLKKQNKKKPQAKQAAKVKKTSNV